MCYTETVILLNTIGLECIYSIEIIYLIDNNIIMTKTFFAFFLLLKSKCKNIVLFCHSLFRS